MLEILAVVMFSKNIAKIIREKGRSPAGYVLLFVLCWFGGEIAGGLVGVLAAAGSEPGLAVYLFALGGAAVGATFAYIVAKSASPLTPPLPLGVPVVQPVLPGGTSSQPPVNRPSALG